MKEFTYFLLFFTSICIVIALNPPHLDPPGIGLTIPQLTPAATGVIDNVTGILTPSAIPLPNVNTTSGNVTVTTITAHTTPTSTASNNSNNASNFTPSGATFLIAKIEMVIVAWIVTGIAIPLFL